jgi:hypothetical protein
MNTKKFVFPLAAVMLILVMTLVACGAKSSNTSSQNVSSNSPATNATPGAGNFTNQPLPLAESLVIGTFKLEGTPNAITSAQATALVPLWQAYAQLTSSNTAAQAEIDSVVSQIQSTMTPQQLQAITAMKLTRQDLTTEMTALGVTNGFGANGTTTPRAPGTTGGGGRGGGGGFFAGGGGGGFAGGVPGGNGTARPTPNATQQALRTQFANRIPTPLMNALISFLQKKG